MVIDIIEHQQESLHCQDHCSGIEECTKKEGKKKLEDLEQEDEYEEDEYKGDDDGDSEA